MYTDRDAIFQKQHEQFTWSYALVIALGILLIVNVPTFLGTFGIFAFSDIGAGIALSLCGVYSILRKKWAPWCAALIGIYLQLAPVFFWAPNAYVYFNDTFIGLFAILFSIVLPGSPNLIEQGSGIPRGWSYNPSSWNQRIPIGALAFICWLSARYMAAFQLGYISTMWDPIFENGTYKVITSDLSKSFPVSDAGLGAFAYSIELLMTFKGGVQRYRTMPWIVFLFGILVVPVGIVSILLIMCQPLVVGAWCFWCLLTAACMLIMIALTLDEVYATVQFLLRCKRKGLSLKHVFWKGSEDQNEDEPLSKIQKRPFVQDMFLGVTLPVTLILSALIGVWLLFCPEVIHPNSALSTFDHIIGALIVVVSMMSLAEVTRKARFVNIAFGLIVSLSPWLLHDSNFWHNGCLGLLLILLSFPKGAVKQRYG